MESEKLIQILRQNGPQTGGELVEACAVDALPLWLCCQRTPAIHSRCIGTRYLRLDRNVEGYARLSPSIRREFLTYTVMGLQDEAIERRAAVLLADIRDISRAKIDLARESMASVTATLPSWPSMAEKVCFIIAGDVTYEMGHAVPRPEISTGKMVQGSDLDIIAIAENDVPQEHLRALDDAILKKKYYLLMQPNYQEEIDYLVKDIAKVREQLAFDTFPHMIAGKIMHEAKFLYGSEAVFRQVKELVAQFDVDKKLTELRQRAEVYRGNAERELLASDASQANAAIMHLFYTSEEGDEIY